MILWSDVPLVPGTVHKPKQLNMPEGKIEPQPLYVIRAATEQEWIDQDPEVCLAWIRNNPLANKLYPQFFYEVSTD